MLDLIKLGRGEKPAGGQGWLLPEMGGLAGCIRRPHQGGSRNQGHADAPNRRKMRELNFRRDMRAARKTTSEQAKKAKNVLGRLKNAIHDAGRAAIQNEGKKSQEMLGSKKGKRKRLTTQGNFANRRKGGPERPLGAKGAVAQRLEIKTLSSTPQMMILEPMRGRSPNTRDPNSSKDLRNPTKKSSRGEQLKKKRPEASCWSAGKDASGSGGKRDRP